ncbi:peptidoglycan-binding protein [Streptomyces gibsoniae]|uniref:Peptidoglycan-binding protein n=1 Tax=Streptomyces gibsoniae TaxID=3075529 RepID=A0ABU2TNI5_9ACTN|nr:peptidoglycan-binding protein [Streptomyces sp. DSM 41699]MDT0462490.1 peptidoglycan-binding protein [Streptomyces sp. DSM 41699]
MKTPAFEEFDPTSDCDCPGCARGRRAGHRTRPCGQALRPAARGVLALAAAAGAVLAVPGQAVSAPAIVHDNPWPIVPAGDEPPTTPQGRITPLHGTGVMPSGVVTPTTTRAAIINRAKKWVAAGVPYSMDDYWSDGYRQDCSGFVSMAWNLGSNEWTGSLDQFGVRISKDELQPGDILLFHNADNPEKGSHVVIFGGWTDYTHRNYTAYEETPPRARRRTTPYAYWSNSSRYVPYRYKGVADSKAAKEGENTPVGVGGAPLPTVGIPGLASVGQDSDGSYVAELGDLLAVRGGSRTRALVPVGVAPGPVPATPPGGRPAGSAKAAGPPAYPGRGAFRPGAVGPDVTLLGRKLMEKGFGRYYTGGPGPRWTEADRRNVEAFQRAQGWRGAAADGYPGPETWRRLFS